MSRVRIEQRTAALAGLPSLALHDDTEVTMIVTSVSQ